MPRKPVNCEHGCGEPIIVKSTVGDAKLLILDDKIKDKQDKLEDVLKSTITIGGIEIGKTYEAGTSLEVILRDLLCGTGPIPESQEVYFGGLDFLPTSAEDIELLTKTTQDINTMVSGVSRNIAADEQYVTIAYKASVGNITSITEDGFEALSDFSNVYTFGDYKFYCTADEVYDPDGEINYIIKWGIN